MQRDICAIYAMFKVITVSKGHANGWQIEWFQFSLISVGIVWRNNIPISQVNLKKASLDLSTTYCPHQKPGPGLN